MKFPALAQRLGVASWDALHSAVITIQEAKRAAASKGDAATVQAIKAEASAMIYHRNSRAMNRKVYQACMNYEAKKLAEKMTKADDVNFADLVSRSEVAKYTDVNDNDSNLTKIDKNGV